jgi:hypothetical protein
MSVNLLDALDAVPGPTSLEIAQAAHVMDLAS